MNVRVHPAPCPGCPRWCSLCSPHPFQARPPARRDRLFGIPHAWVHAYRCGYPGKRTPRRVFGPSPRNGRRRCRTRGQTTTGRSRSRRLHLAGSLDDLRKLQEGKGGQSVGAAAAWDCVEHDAARRRRRRTSKFKPPRARGAGAKISRASSSAEEGYHGTGRVKIPSPRGLSPAQLSPLAAPRTHERGRASVESLGQCQRGKRPPLLSASRAAPLTNGNTAAMHHARWQRAGVFLWVGWGVSSAPR